MSGACLGTGMWVSAAKVLDAFNPATSDKAGSVPDLGANDARQVIAAPDAAWPA